MAACNEDQCKQASIPATTIDTHDVPEVGPSSFFPRPPAPAGRPHLKSNMPLACASTTFDAHWHYRHDAAVAPTAPRRPRPDLFLNLGGMPWKRLTGGLCGVLWLPTVLIGSGNVRPRGRL